MLNNLVNRHDAARLVRKAHNHEFARMASKLTMRGEDRVVANWSAVDPSLSEWWAVPRVLERWNALKTGLRDITYPEYVAERYLGRLGELDGISLGCGTGVNEAIWAHTESFKSLKGIDVSPERIRFATELAQREGLESVLDFEEADVNAIRWSGRKFDVVLGLQSLHHFSALSQTIPELGALLRPGGYFVVDEFVGPTRFQWTDPQLEAANRLLRRLPESRRRRADGTVKDSVHRPSRLSMLMDDPSEAVDSNALLPAIKASFEVVEERPYGGTILHLTFSGIAHNFLGEDPETQELLEMCFEAEDSELVRLGHDFIALVCRPLTTDPVHQNDASRASGLGTTSR